MDTYYNISIFWWGFENQRPSKGGFEYLRPDRFRI